jgi:hypothetical protein
MTVSSSLCRWLVVLRAGQRRGDDRAGEHGEQKRSNLVRMLNLMILNV